MPPVFGTDKNYDMLVFLLFLYSTKTFFSGPQYSQLIRAPSSPTEELTFAKGFAGSAEHTREKTAINISPGSKDSPTARKQMLCCISS